MHNLTLSDAQLALVHAALDDAAELRSEYPNDECSECDSMHCDDELHQVAPRVEHLYTTLRHSLPQTSTALYNVTTADALADVNTDPVRVTLDDMVQAYSAGHEDGGRDLPCEFIDMLVQLYVAAGEVTAAESLIYCHHEADYHPDAYIGHYMPEIEDEDDDDLSALRDAAAAAYVAAL